MNDPKEIINNIWCVLRPNLSNTKIKSFGIMGTGFFVSPQKFVTAYHLLQNKSFVPNDNYNNNYIVLKNLLGNEIEVNLENNISYFPDKDLTIINFDQKYDFLELTIHYQNDEDIRNLGFPSESINLLFDENSNLKQIFQQKGKILKTVNDFSSRTSDVNIKNKKVIVTDYSSMVGFSGGPLINDSGEVVGMMSMVMPDTEKIFPNKSVAISASEF